MYPHPPYLFPHGAQIGARISLAVRKHEQARSVHYEFAAAHYPRDPSRKNGFDGTSRLKHLSRPAACFSRAVSSSRWRLTRHTARAGAGRSGAVEIIFSVESVSAIESNWQRAEARSSCGARA